ncbi:hypothetical protein M5K25_002298 [Dendrobium thyrsiflorum]|uniref:Uncharacterized protein n=1 Tax=Dendrobium thyrsiflorum TaxID=117978 RepID=A0ABD0W456_DENTH
MAVEALRNGGSHLKTKLLDYANLLKDFGNPTLINLAVPLSSPNPCTLNPPSRRLPSPIPVTTSSSSPPFVFSYLSKQICMADPDVDHGFVFDEQGRTDILRFSFFDVYFSYDETANDYIDRILYQLTLSIEEHIRPGCWIIVGRPLLPHTPTTSPTTTLPLVTIRGEEANFALYCKDITCVKFHLRWVSYYFLKQLFSTKKTALRSNKKAIPNET